MRKDDLLNSEYINEIRVLTEIIRHTVAYANEHDLLDLMEYINSELNKIA